MTGVEELLTTLSFHEKSPPQRFIGRQITLLDPLTVSLVNQRLYDRYVANLQIENAHGEPVVISQVKVHLGPANVQGTAPDYQRFLRSETILPAIPTAQPWCIFPREQSSCVINFFPQPLPPHMSALLPGGNFAPTLVVVWRFVQSLTCFRNALGVACASGLGRILTHHRTSLPNCATMNAARPRSAPGCIRSTPYQYQLPSSKMYLCQPKSSVLSSQMPPRTHSR
jgi:hypothetical protein